MTTSAIVIGASMAGLLTARALSDHVDRVEVVERDTLTDDPLPRRGVPQGRHAHAILASGEQLIARWFPAVVAELEAGGAARVCGTDAWWHQAGAYKVRTDWGGAALCVSRPFLEATVRAHLRRLPKVTVCSGVSVDGLVIDDTRVTGVVVDGQHHRADLVVDCSGRHTRFVDQLEQAGFAAPGVSHIKIDMAYGTRILRRRPDDFDGTMSVIVGGADADFRAAVLLPIEGDRWILTLAGFHGDVPPTDDDGYVAFARSLPSPLIADLLARAEPLSPVMTHRMATSQRRHFDRLRRWPAGFIALGDAVCSFNPMYGQGMSSAALQADSLGTIVGRHGAASPKVARLHYRRAARIVDNPWRIAAGADFTHPQTSGPKPLGTDVVNRYIAKVMLASHVSPHVQSQLIRVQNLLAPPQSLMAPRTMIRVLRAARRSPVVTGLAETGPVVGRPVATVS